MNREILFRGKTLYDHYDHYASPKPDTKEGTWVYGDLMTEYPSHKGLTIVEKGVCHEVDPETVGQYTGLKDKNSVKIFEGDICKYRYGRSTYIGKVVFNTRACIFEMRRTEIVGYHGERAIKTQLLNHIDKVEVISTIHDNPELLEVKRCEG